MNSLAIFFETLKSAASKVYEITKHQDFFKFIILSFIISMITTWVAILFIIPGIIEMYNAIGVTGFKLTYGGMSTIQSQMLIYDFNKITYLFKSFGVFVLPIIFFVTTFFVGKMGTKIVFETFDIKDIEINNDVFVKLSTIDFLQFIVFGLIVPFGIIYVAHDVFPFYVSILILISARKIFFGIIYGVLGQIYPVSEIKKFMKTKILTAYVIGSLAITVSSSFFILIPFCIAYIFGLSGYYIEKLRLDDKSEIETEKLANIS